MRKITGTSLEFDLAKAIENAITEALKNKLNFLENPKNEREELLTRNETAKMLRISLPTLHAWTKEGLITAFRIGTRVLYQKADVLNALSQIRAPFKKGGNHGI